MFHGIGRIICLKLQYQQTSSFFVKHNEGEKWKIVSAFTRSLKSADIQTYRNRLTRKRSIWAGNWNM